MRRLCFLPGIGDKVVFLYKPFMQTHEVFHASVLGKAEEANVLHVIERAERTSVVVFELNDEIVKLVVVLLLCPMPLSMLECYARDTISHLEGRRRKFDTSFFPELAGRGLFNGKLKWFSLSAGIVPRSQRPIFSPFTHGNQATSYSHEDGD